MKSLDRIRVLSRGVESLSKEEHGVFFDAMQRLGLSNEVKQAAVVLYLDFKSRPVGEYNAAHYKNMTVFIVASVSLAAKAMGDLRTDQEFESKMFVGRERLVDAEDRILKSLMVQDSVIPYSELVPQLTRRQIESMAEGFAERGLIDSNEKEQLVQQSYECLDAAVKRGLSPTMTYRGRAAAVIFKAVRDLRLPVPTVDVARAAGFDERTMRINTHAIDALLKNPESSEAKG